VIILKKVDTAIAALPSLSPQDFDFSLANKLLQCSRKIDKITLYCLQCAVGTQQTDPHISAIIEYMVTKLELLLGLENAQLKK
jgi:thymidine kinase